MTINISGKNNNKVRRRSPRAKKNSRFLELAIVAIFALVVIYGASFALRISNGVSKTVDVPVYNVRLQLLNGCGTRGVADRIAKSLPSLAKMPLELSVIEVSDFKAYDVNRSFIISREPDLTAAKTLANQLNLDNDNIVYEPIENNYRNISVSLVLGKDYREKFRKSLE